MIVAIPKVSICIPTYNGSKFIGTALASAAAQTYPNLEVVVSDDRSEDETVAIVQAWQQRSAIATKILTHARYGLVGNWNFCVQHVLSAELDRPKYIKFLFQDDLLNPDCIAEMVAVAEQDEAIALVFSRRHVIYETGELSLPESMQWLRNLHTHWQNLQPVQSGLDLLADPNLLNQPDNKIGEPTNVLLRSDIFNSLGLFDCTLRQFCDLEMWLRIAAHRKIAFVDRELATFRVHAQQTTSSNLAQDQIWHEIYRVWQKMLFHPIYQPLPASMRWQIYRHCVQSLMREYARSILRQRWHRIAPMHSLISALIKQSLLS